MSKRILTNGEVIEKARATSAPVYHDELSKAVREVFNNLPDSEVERLINASSLGRSCIVEAPLSKNFEKKYRYDINNIIRVSPLFESIRRIEFPKNEGPARIWLRGDIRKFLPEEHALRS